MRMPAVFNDCITGSLVPVLRGMKQPVRLVKWLISSGMNLLDREIDWWGNEEEEEEEEEEKYGRR